MRVSLHFLMPALVAGVIGLLACGPASLPECAAQEADVATLVAEMQAAAKAKDEGQTIAKMVALEGRLDESINKALLALTKNKSEKIAHTAMAHLAVRKDKTFEKALGAQIKAAKKKGKDEDKTARYVAYIDAAAKYRNPKFSKALVDVVKKYLPLGPDELTAAAIRAYGTVESKDVVEQLLKWMNELEAGGQGQGGKNQSAEARDRKARNKQIVIETLSELTGQDIGDSKTWKKFWESNKKTFEFPGPDAPEIDVTTLTEWTDPAYGFTVKHPAGEGWKFAAVDASDTRIELNDHDEKEGTTCRVQFILHNLSTQNPKTMKELAKWYVGDFTENRFNQMTTEEAENKDRKIGGREFTIVSAKGEAKGNYKGWGSAEHRVYMTQVDHIVVRYECWVSLGVEPEKKKAFWDALEGITWK